MKIVICGLSITSSWGNGHATTYRGLMRELVRLGHEVLFLERDMPWYAANRDLPVPGFGRTELYQSLEDLKDRFTDEIRRADAVIVGSFVPDGVEVGNWVVATAKGLPVFYDIDTPVTLARLASGNRDYLSPELVPRYALYLSFTGGPVLRTLETRYRSPKARALYCSVDTTHYSPEEGDQYLWDLGYLGTYSDDRQSMLNRLVNEPAKAWPEGRFVVAGPQYPESLSWALNVERIQHLSPDQHRRFYNRQRFTLNVTRKAMVRAGFSPSVRLFEAAACATPIISDFWPGLDSIFEIGREILVAVDHQQALKYLREMPEEERIRLGWRARQKVLQFHTASHRAAELENYLWEAQEERAHGQNRHRFHPEVGEGSWSLVS